MHKVVCMVCISNMFCLEWASPPQLRIDEKLFPLKVSEFILLMTERCHLALMINGVIQMQFHLEILSEWLA